MIDVGDLKVGDRVINRLFKIGTVSNIEYKRTVDNECEYISINFDDGSYFGISTPTREIEKVSIINEEMLKEKDKMIKIGNRYCFDSKADYIDFLETVEKETDITWFCGQKPTAPECIEYYKENICIHMNSYGMTQGSTYGNEIKWKAKTNKGDKNMFKVGDRVVSKEFGKGTIIYIENNNHLVEFDVKSPTLHSGDGRGKTDSCWWYSACDLTKCSENNKKEKKEMKEKFVGKYKVIINDPAVILFKHNPFAMKEDKYVAKAHNEDFDPEKGLLMCLAKAHGISHLDLKRMLKGAKVQKKPEIKTVVIETEGKPESYKEEPKRKYDANEGLPEVCCYKKAKSPVGKHHGKPYTFKIGDTVIVRDCFSYKEQKPADILNLLNKQLTIVDIFEDDFTKFYAVRYNDYNYFFVGSELEPVWED